MSQVQVQVVMLSPVFRCNVSLCHWRHCNFKLSLTVWFDFARTCYLLSLSFILLDIDLTLDLTQSGNPRSSSWTPTAAGSWVTTARGFTWSGGPAWKGPRSTTWPSTWSNLPRPLREDLIWCVIWILWWIYESYFWLFLVDFVLWNGFYFWFCFVDFMDLVVWIYGFYFWFCLSWILWILLCGFMDSIFEVVLWSWWIFVWCCNSGDGFAPWWRDPPFETVVAEDDRAEDDVTFPMACNRRWPRYGRMVHLLWWKWLSHLRGVLSRVVTEPGCDWAGLWILLHLLTCTGVFTLHRMVSQLVIDSIRANIARTRTEKRRLNACLSLTMSMSNVECHCPCLWHTVFHLFHMLWHGSDNSGLMASSSSSMAKRREWPMTRKKRVVARVCACRVCAYCSWWWLTVIDNNKYWIQNVKI